MRSLDLARVAAQAEMLHLRRQARRAMLRALLGIAAGAFLLGAVLLAHVVVWLALAPRLGQLGAAGAMAGLDVVLALLLALFAAHLPPDRLEREARLLRDAAWEGAARDLSTPTQLLRLLAIMWELVPRRQK